MSLDYDLTKVEDREVHFPPESNGSMNGNILSMIWFTIPTGIPVVTEANASEFAYRMAAWGNLIGPMFNKWEGPDGGSPTPIIPDLNAARRAVGLRTNANPKSRAQFHRDLYAAWMRYEDVEVTR